MARILLISEVVPLENGVGGYKTLFIHMSESKVHKFSVISDGRCDRFPQVILKHSVLSRIIKRLCIPGLGWLPVYCRERINPFNIDEVLRVVDLYKPDAILTVAHGYLWRTALHVAKLTRTPLISIFYDWWPELIYLPAWGKSRVSRELFELKDNSSLIFSICNGMSDHLGNHANLKLLLPVSSRIGESIGNYKSSLLAKTGYVLRYLGNTGEYGDMLESAMQTFMSDSSHRLEIGGSIPKWKNLSLSKLKSQNLLHGFIPENELDSWLASCDFLLVLSSFNPNNAIFASTSLPSKVSTYLQLGKPIIAWAPAYSAVGRLFQVTNCGYLVDNPSPLALLQSIDSFDKDMYSYYSRMSTRVYRELFTQSALQKIFDEAVSQCLPY